jgi:hypothetical protein
MFASMNAMTAANAQVVDHLDHLATRRVVGELDRAGGDATMAVDASAFNRLDDWP